MARYLLCLFILAAGAVIARAQGELRIPACTAYLQPDSGVAEISSTNAITGWSDPSQKILWFGELKAAGSLHCAVQVKLPAGRKTNLRLTVAGESREAWGVGKGNVPLTLDFGAVDINTAGYQSFTLESLNHAGRPSGDVEALLLDGPATAGAHFNLNPGRGRAAASVHLWYPVAPSAKVTAFYCEVTGTVTPVSTYFEACGWHRGYFGMQVNSPMERRIIFSVWDSGSEKDDRNQVADEDRVRLIAKGEGVFAGDFGHEGTGGHSHLVCNWKTGEKQRFLATAKIVDASHTIYSGYWFHPEKRKWVLISSWQAPRDGAYMHGLYSFIEDFDGDNGQLNRRGYFGNQWMQTADGQWTELTNAKFTCDATGRTDRLDRFGGVENGQFFLSTGGYQTGFTKYDDELSRPAIGQKPSDLHLPPLPE